VDIPSKTKTPAEIGKALRKGAPSKMNHQLFYAKTKDARDANHPTTQGGSVAQELTSDEWVRFAAPAARLPPLTRALQKDSSEESKGYFLERKMGALQKEMGRVKTDITEIAGRVTDLERVNQALVTSDPLSVEDGSNP
jgi:hypothetical protein